MSKIAVLVEIEVDDVKLALNNGKRVKMGQQMLSPVDLVDNTINDAFRIVEGVTSVNVAVAEMETKNETTPESV